MLGVFGSIYGELEPRGDKPSLHILNNKCSHAVKQFLKAKETNHKLVEAHNHAVNAVKHAVTSVKFHTMSHFAITDPHCPIQIWCKLIPTIEITLNLLQKAQVDGTKSAYKVLHGRHFDWNRTPVASIGTRPFTCLPPDTRNTFQDHTFDTWYVGPVMEHCRLLILSIQQQCNARHRHLPTVSGALHSPVDLQG